MGANTVSQAEWDQWEAERIERARADLKRTAWQNAQPKGTDHLTDRILDLETRLYLCGVLLESALELLDTRAKQHARVLELVATIERLDEIVAAPPVRLAA